ncbi:HNH endonuclease [Pseudomonas frederiksbergensis]|uniref:HNH endonuclease n=1 Tax=Pseudomonas frederiksbergensis TaxID=104087 RepID=UPI002DBF8703|nr:HNH endonuclease [Pseudomonas frederiksbergensis]WRV67952.1 HNH endonuclease [Pseudomonas frederiksbergensis]
MKRLPLPQFDATEAVQTCASGITIEERAQALLAALPVIRKTETAYRELAPAGKLYEMEATDVVTSELDGTLMGVIYKSHFARNNSPSRLLYEQIKMAPEFGICPLCGQRIVATVDHYLPQSLYPALNLTPVNLVPACSDCNKRKLAGVAARAEDQTLHPYYDDLGTERWLIAKIIPSSPPAVAFTIRPPAVWSEVLTARANHHFEVLGLPELYAAQAASEMADISYSLEELGEATGPTGIGQHLDQQFRTRFWRDRNSWRTALYEGLRDSEWFCNEGYRQIRPR